MPLPSIHYMQVLDIVHVHATKVMFGTYRLQDKYYRGWEDVTMNIVDSYNLVIRGTSQSTDLEEVWFHILIQAYRVL